MKKSASLAGFAASLICLSSAAAAQPAPETGSLSAKDAQFLTKAIMGDNSEISFGKLAEMRGPVVKSFGVMLVQDHTQARDQASALAKSDGLSPPPGLSAGAEREYSKLSRLGGPQFDVEFTRYMIKDHRKDIADFRREAKRAGPVADLARSTLPVLEKHLTTAIGLSQQGS